MRLIPPHSNHGFTAVEGRFELELAVMPATGVGLLVMAILGCWGAKAMAEPIYPLVRSFRDNAHQPSSRAASQAILYVNPTKGNDQADGSERSPFRTITHALQIAQPNSVIQLAAGTYSAETGESFPLVMKPGVTIQGDGDRLGQDTVIQGGGVYASPTFAEQNVAVLGANQAQLIGVTVTNPNGRGYGLWIESTNPTILNSTFTNSTRDGISVAGNSTPTLKGNVFMLNGGSGISIFGSSRPDVRSNQFVRTGFGINVAQNAAPQIIDNRISQNRVGIVIQASARPVLRGNTIEDSERDGLVAIAQSQPDLGTAAEPGNNTFINSGQHDINAAATNQTIPAFGNHLASNRIVGQLDLAGKTQVASSSPTTAVSESGRSTVLRSLQRPSTPISQLPPAIPAASNQTAVSSHPALPTPQSTPSETAFGVVTISAPAASRSPQPLTSASLSSTAQAGQTTRIPTPPPAASLPAQPARTIATAAPAVIPPSAAPGAISIPVPPPARSVTQTLPAAQFVATASSSPARSIRPTMALATHSSRAAMPIDIPVPPPETGSVSSSSSNPSLTPPPQTANSSTPSSLLPVPSAEIPVGNTGDLRRVSVAGLPTQNTGGSAGFAGTQTAVADLRYRVVVQADDDEVKSLVRSIIPSAFPTATNGQSLMQVGAFSSRDNAEQAMELLSRNGLRAEIQPIE
jgi:parallel beta-helix repeat protein